MFGIITDKRQMVNGMATVINVMVSEVNMDKKEYPERVRIRWDNIPLNGEDFRVYSPIMVNQANVCHWCGQGLYKIAKDRKPFDQPFDTHNDDCPYKDAIEYLRADEYDKLKTEYNKLFNVLIVNSQIQNKEK